MKRFIVSLLSASAILAPVGAVAQTAVQYQLTDSGTAVWHVRGFQCQTSQLCLAYVPVDYTGSVFGVSANPFFVALTAAQLSTLTPPAAITNYASETGGNLANIYGAIGNGSSPAANTLQARLAAIDAALASLFQAGGSIGNTSFGISGTIPSPTTAAGWGLGSFGSVMPTIGQATGVYDGTNLVRARGDETNGIWVNVKAGGAGGGAVYGPTPVGSAAANPPVLTGGTVDGTGTGAVSVWKVVSGVGYLNMTQWAGTALGAPSAWGTPPSGNVIGVNDNMAAMGGAAINSGCVGALSGYSSTIPSTACGVFGSYVLNTLPPGQATAANSSPVVLPAAQITTDPCTLGTKLNFSFSQTSSGTIITGTSGKKNYICSIHYIASAAANVSLVEYSGACTGGTAYVLDGSSTAANGPGYAANGGITLGNGGASVLTGAGNTNSGYNVCALQNGSATVAGGGTYVQQ